MATNFPQKQLNYKKFQPAIYDYVFQNHLDWPCTTCQWGPIISENEEYIRQKIFFATKTDGIYNETDNSWSKQPSSIIVAHVDTPRQGKTFNQGLRNLYLQEKLKKHSNLKVKQIIIHPGDANIMKKCPKNQKMLATKNDNNQIFIWDLDKHKVNSNTKDNYVANQPDICLTGHNSNTPSFALEWAQSSYRIASGGKDLKILIWDLEEYQNKMQPSYMYQSKRELNSIGSNEQLKIPFNIELKGHKDMIEDLSFSPIDKDQLVSVSDDKQIIYWDLRASHSPIYQIGNLHSDDINCVDWNIQNPNYIATGSSDTTAHIVDLRKRDSVQKIQLKTQHKDYPNNILSIQFSPFDSRFLAVGANELYIYNIEKSILTENQMETENQTLQNDNQTEIQNQTQNQTNNLNYEDNLQPIFTHIGCHGAVNNFDWNRENPWSILCTCQENPDEIHSIGGGQLQSFRPIDLTYLSQDEAVEKLLQGLNNSKEI
ncbi:WD40-repeat-containing domain [Pseudocohnilembus persalinus]|uniref:WD40-repeat-containing domain n=1 Tax=Pseudocohnilembus persalinus TaxID=266149 RepID=A0A0V0QXW7_PSEPJ|nr:WD40-repeat-containing domain [Pseudocohnilembus persalinus]|eukprot:KRX07074.1 WD40-repeat-containing domain [Pseudocohnilembus persalinus]